MSKNVKKVIWIVLGAVVFSTALSVLLQSHRTDDAKQAFEETRRQLRAQGFKTDLSDYDHSIDAAARARTAPFLFLKEPLSFGPHADYLDLEAGMSNDNASVIWEGEMVKTYAETISWQEVQNVLEADHDAFDAACEAAMPDDLRIGCEFKTTDSA